MAQQNRTPAAKTGAMQPPEQAVRRAPENMARAETPAEADARRRRLAIAQAEAQAAAELEARAKQ